MLHIIAPDNDCAGKVDAMNLKYLLRDIHARLR
jgi:hypothetical protein